MPYVRRRRFQRRPRRIMRARRRRTAVPRGIPLIYRFKRMNNYLFIANQGTAGTIGTNDTNQITLGTVFADFAATTYQFGASMAFRLNNVPGYTDFTNLYDQYRIDKVKVRFLPLTNSATPIQNGGILPTVFVDVRHDSSTVPANMNALREAQGIREYRLDRPFTVSLRPKWISTVGDPLQTAVIGAAPRTGWIDTGYYAANHFGLGLWFSNLNLASTLDDVYTMVRIDITYYLSMREPQ